MERPEIVLPIGKGDELDIAVFGVPDLSTHERVNSLGDISMPLIDYVHVDGLTTEQAEQLIERRLISGGYLKNPHVTVFVKEFTTVGVSVLGQVKNPGIYPVVASRRLWDMVLAAGGTTDRAGNVVTIHHRDLAAPASIVTLSNDPEKSLQSNVEILPGDTVVVSKAGVVYVLGEVTQPAGYVMENGEPLSVVTVLAMAHGPTKDAKLNGTKIIRKTGNGSQEIVVHVQDIFRAKAPDLQLMAGDILFVPGRRGRYASSTPMNTLLLVAASLAVHAY